MKYYILIVYIYGYILYIIYKGIYYNIIDLN